jgi:hypothetical protein
MEKPADEIGLPLEIYPLADAKTSIGAMKSSIYKTKPTMVAIKDEVV